MKIAFFQIEDREETPIRDRLGSHELFLSRDTLDASHLPAERGFEIVSTFVDSRLDEAMLVNFPDLKLVATRSTGYDHIDLAYCKRRGISAAYVPGYGDNTVAEFAFGLLLNLSRRIYRGIDQIKETGSFSLEGLRGVDLKGKTLGVVGTGRIGSHAIQIGRGFGMNVVAYDPYPREELAAQLGFRYASLTDLLAQSDFTTIHCPGGPATFHLINKDNVGAIKKGAYLVNTARGSVVETDALVTALREGIVAGAAVDVLEEEGETKDEITFLRTGHPKEEELKTVLENHALMHLPNVLITPHMAFDSQEALERILTVTLDNIDAFLHQKPQNLVPLP